MASADHHTEGKHEKMLISKLDLTEKQKQPVIEIRRRLNLPPGLPATPTITSLKAVYRVSLADTIGGEEVIQGPGRNLCGHRCPVLVYCSRALTM